MTLTSRCLPLQPCNIEDRLPQIVITGPDVLSTHFPRVQCALWGERTDHACLSGWLAGVKYIDRDSGDGSMKVMVQWWGFNTIEPHVSHLVGEVYVLGRHESRRLDRQGPLVGRWGAAAQGACQGKPGDESWKAHEAVRTPPMALSPAWRYLQFQTTLRLRVRTYE